MKITILNENYVDKQNLISEHGLSILIQVKNYNIIFDTGQNLSVVNNYKYLAENVSKVDFIVLSHGHYDHTGGLAKHPEFFKKLANKIFASKYVFDKHLRKKSEKEFDEIGLSKDVCDEFHFEYIDDYKEINDDIYILSNIKRYEPFVADLRLYCEIDGKYVRDPFRDELYMFIKHNGKNILITGCSHAGIINIVKDCQNKMNVDRIDYLIGGMHLFRSDEATIDRVVDFFLNEIKVENIITGHCTGLDPFFYIKSKLKSNLFYMKTGMVFNI
ncbi:MBL fold metallo-hydrolase [Deferribacter autotrophicus]|uniref:MBL fold metallo-hydrolase n=1 Tax=Deferribacter autotrophicus TaxID=500465 RepID=A0A5A8F5K2_9BACT|nr:MBL fold metallo-hydrolase [Deferribacter autotrophicus]KAA0259414.1 MBL fold metallo-hydrolase [Deferribacter autotrophicus]